MATSSPTISARPRSVEDLRLGSGPVRRNLFGPVDHQALQQDFQRMLKVSVEEATERWSYDFQADRPAQSSTSTIEWEELRCQDIPAFYRNCLVKRGGGGIRAAMGVAERMSQSNKGVDSPNCSSGEEYLEVTATRRCYRLKRPEKKTAGMKAARRRQAIITDFFMVKKTRFLHRKHADRQ